MASGTWTFADVPQAREMFGRYKMPKKEIRLTDEQLASIAGGYCVILFTGQEILFIARGEEADELHDDG